MNDDMIRVSQPTVDAQTRQELMEVFDNGWLGRGPKTDEFEKAFAIKVGKPFAYACNSGTAALDMALKLRNINGGELITTPMTFVADAIVGEWHDMDVTFADIDEDTLCLDPKSLVVTDNTKAIIAVDSHGRLADWKGIREASRQDIAGIGFSNPLLIEDAAHAMWTPGVGTDSDIQMYSFQAVKTLPAGDGGMLTVTTEEQYRELKKISWLNVEKTTYDRSLGKKYTWDYDITAGNGIKSYMNDINATIANGQLRRLDETNAKRRAIQSTYNEAFKDIPQIKIPQFSYTVQYYTVQCEDRNRLGEHLAEEGIATSVHFKPLSEMTYWKKAVKRPLPVTDRVWPKLLSLPVHDALTWLQVEKIIDQVKRFYD